MNALIVAVSVAWLSACNMVDPAVEDDENTAPSLAPQTSDDWYLVLGQKRQGTLYPADADLDQITLSADGTIGPGENPLANGATFNESTGTFTWKPTTAPLDIYSIRFTATDNGSPPLSSSRDKQLYLTDLTGLGAYFKEQCDRCHIQTVDFDRRLSTLQVPCDADGIEVALHTANIVVPEMQLVLGLSSVAAQDSDLVDAYNTDVNAAAVYLSSLFQALPYVCSISDQAVVVGNLLEFDLLTTGSASDYTFNMQAVPAEGLYPGDSAFNTISGRFSWTPSTAGEYAAKFTIVENATMTEVLNVTVNMSVTLNTFALGQDLYTGNCVGCHRADALDMINLPPATQAEIVTAINSAIASVPSMAGYSTTLDSQEIDAIAEYLDSLL